MHERYSIEVNDESVEIYGELTIEETFDFLSFFERKGYKSVILGTENTTLHLLKRDQSEEIFDQRVTDLKDEVEDYQKWLEKEKESHQKTTKRLNYVEALLKSLMSENYTKYQKLHQENMELLKAQCIQKLSENPEVQQILNKEDKDEEIQKEKLNEEC